MHSDETLLFVKVHTLQVSQKAKVSSSLPIKQGKRSAPKKRVSFENFDNLSAFKTEQVDVKKVQLIKSRSFEVVVSDIDDSSEQPNKLDESIASDFVVTI